MLPSINTVKQPGLRRYNKIGSQAMAAIMHKLERFGYVFRNNHATFCSPAYPVPKANVDHTAPPEQQYRLTVDLRVINLHTIPTRFPLPRLETFVERVAGMTYFGTLDLFNGYWQLPLDESCRKYFSIMTDAGIWTPYRLIQGSRNAAGPFQAAICDVLGDLVNTGCIVYIDDILIFGRTEEEFVDNWLAILRLLHTAKLKVSAKKTCFFAQNVKYCGRIFSKDGVSFDPALLNTIIHMPTPTTAAELRSYLATTNWIRSSIPRYAELIAPLQQLLTTALATTASDGSTLNAKRIKLAEIGWTDTHTDTFRAINRAVAQSTALAYPEDSHALCVYTDASDLHWAGIVTQTSKEELAKPAQEQTHRPLAFVSGSFSGSQLQWPTIEKEGYGILATLTKCAHLLQRSEPFQLFTDHRNLKYIFSPDPAVFDGRKQAADRIERWLLVMRAFNYNIQHIAGEDNIAADMFSRWASTPADTPINATVRVARTRRQTQPAQATPTLETPATPDVESPSDATTATEPPTEPTGNTASITQDVAIEFTPDDYPSLTELREAQRTTLRPADIRTFKLKADDTGLYRDGRQRIYVPDTRHLRVRLCISAHQGLAGHRAVETTTKWLTEHFTWLNIDRDIRTIVQSCLHCMRTKGGHVVPRPWLQTAQATTVNQILHFDYFHVRQPSDTNPMQYILVIMDGFSKFVELIPCTNADSATAVTALLDWFKRYGIATQWTSDRGRHFLNNVMRDLSHRLGTSHHFTAAYAPWSNGQVERVNREIREMLSALISETKAQHDTWPQFLPIVNYAINASPSTSLAGLSPFTIFTGRKPGSPLMTIFDKNTATVNTVAPTSLTLQTHTAKLQQALHDLHQRVTKHPRRKQTKRNGETAIDFDIGDYVLTTQPRTTRDKTVPIWNGPVLVVGTVNDRVFKIRDLLTGEIRERHADQLRRYADKNLTITTQLRNFIAHQACECPIDAIIAHRQHRDKWQLLISWQGFGPEDHTWEDLDIIFDDAPTLVDNYIKTITDTASKTALTNATKTD
jgi:transposase InsO family protein